MTYRLALYSYSTCILCTYILCMYVIPYISHIHRIHKHTAGGMIPKLETATQAVEAGAGIVTIVDGRVKYSVLRALSSEPFGTRIVKG